MRLRWSGDKSGWSLCDTGLRLKLTGIALTAAGTLSCGNLRGGNEKTNHADKS